MVLKSLWELQSTNAVGMTSKQVQATLLMEGNILYFKQDEEYL